MKKETARILLYDIETSYTTAAVWGLYDQNVAKVLVNPYIITVAWKWLGEKTTHVISLPDFNTYKKDKRNDKELVQVMHELFEEADVIIAHNGNSFDQKWTYARFLVHGMKPPSPSLYIDTKLEAKRYFRFNSNSLNNLGQYLGLGKKVDTGGIDLWFDCIENNDPKAWGLMCKYNKQDVVLLEKVYLKMKPYMKTHPVFNVVGGEVTKCPCGSHKIQKRGYAKLTNGRTKPRLQCQECGKWFLGKMIPIPK